MRYARFRWVALGALLFLLLGLAVGLASLGSNEAPSVLAETHDWPQFNLNAQHDGNNTGESLINAANVGKLQKLYQVDLPGTADGAPVYLSAVSTAHGLKNLVFVTTKAGDLVALDGDSGSQIWVQHNPAGSCRINGGGSTCYTTSSPVLDPNRQFVYSYGLDGYVHKYEVAVGTEIKSDGWPELASRKPFDEKGSSALTLATAHDGNSYLYAAQAGYPGDRGDYQGHLTTINLKDGSQHVFNMVCSNQTDVHFTEPGDPNCPTKQTALWTRAAVVYDPDTDRIYTATGNGTFDPARHDWGDTVFALNPDGTGLNGDPLDTYTPANYQRLQDTDADLGSTAPAILPTPANSKVRHLAVQAGKDVKLRLLNLDNLSGQGGIGHTGGEVNNQIIDVPQGGVVVTMPAVWVNPADNTTWVFVTNSDGVAGLKLSLDGSGNPSLIPVWQKNEGGFSPIMANGVLYYARSGDLMALDPLSGNQLWHDGAIGDIHWESPIVNDGVLYITDGNSKLTAYALNGKLPTTATAFYGVWFRTDKPVADGVTTRTWLWGPQPFFEATEIYDEAAGGKRSVQYYDKSRMEITYLDGDRSSPYYVTNGLLVTEMVSGQMQVGDHHFSQRSPATLGVAGDPDDSAGPTYASLAAVTNGPAAALGTTVTATLNRTGSMGSDATKTSLGVVAAYYVPETKHTIAKPFWDFLNSQGLVYGNDGRPVNEPLFSPTFYATGFPLTEAYWGRVKVGGVVKDVLIQAFERRVLTYTPSNPVGFQVEMGNVGRHYYRWRYGG